MQPVRTFGFPILPFFLTIELLESVSDFASDDGGDMFSFLTVMVSFDTG